MNLTSTWNWKTGLRASGASVGRSSPDKATLKKPMAERVGFEPTVAFATPHFECGALDHYATSPGEMMTHMAPGIHPPAPTPDSVGVSVHACSESRCEASVAEGFPKPTLNQASAKQRRLQRASGYRSLRDLI